MHEFVLHCDRVPPVEIKDFNSGGGLSEMAHVAGGSSEMAHVGGGSSEIAHVGGSSEMAHVGGGSSEMARVGGQVNLCLRHPQGIQAWIVWTMFYILLLSA